MTITHTNPLLQSILAVTGTETIEHSPICAFTNLSEDSHIEVHSSGSTYHLVGMHIIDGHVIFYGVGDSESEWVSQYFSTTLVGTIFLDEYINPQHRNVFTNDAQIQVRQLTEAWVVSSRHLTN